MFDAVEEDQGRQAGAFSVEERGSGDAADDAQGVYCKGFTCRHGCAL
jgi:hypothetical protein